MLASNIPAKFNIPFANAAGGSFIRTIPQASQIGLQDGAASLTDGFPPLTMNPVGTPPFGQDMNGILFESTSWDRWFSAGAPVPFDAAFSAAVGGYPKGAQVASATTFGVWWLSTTDNNVTDPDAAGAGWVRVSPLNLYGVDTGAANAYNVAFSPPLLVHVIGLPLHFKILNGNTAASTVDFGPGAAAIVRRDGSALIGGELVTSRVATVIWNGTAYEWQGLAPAPAAAIAAGTDSQSALPPSAFNSKLLATDGYQVFPGGLIMQWGRYPTLITAEGPIAVTFPVAFTTAFYSGQVTGGNENANNNDLWPEIVYTTNPPTTTTMVVYINGLGVGTARLNGFNWFVIGK